MGLLQKAVETYDSHSSLIGVYQEGKSVLAPIAHTVKKADIEIAITANGEFFDANSCCKNEAIIVPVSEKSAGRSGSTIAPHPLCDQICYLAPYSAEKYDAYIENLKKWIESEHSHPKLNPILKYVQRGKIIDDLKKLGLIKLDKNDIPINKNNAKLFVRWRVLGLDDGKNENCWEDDTLFSAYMQYYQSILDVPAFCMVSGEVHMKANQHLKGVVSMHGNAKLISSNDTSGFTYRGRFTEESQALTISYETSQKAHNALRWLVDNQGVRATFGGRTFLCWNPQGGLYIPPHQPFMRASEPIFNPSNYRMELQKALNAKEAELELSDGVVLAAFDAATTGRLSLTYYNELMGHDFLQRLHDWDAACCWPHRYDGIRAPYLTEIVRYAFGTQRTEKGQTKMKASDGILRQQMQRLIACRIDKAAIDYDIVHSLVNRASNLIAYKAVPRESKSENIRENLLFVTCAVVRKFRMDKYKEEWNMALEPERKDRSYQFGRLLAVMEKVERDTYERDEKREPNAIRLQSMFCRRPLQTADILETQLVQPYYSQLKPGIRNWYKNLSGQIMEMISTFPEEEWNKPLDSTYLMGYYLQRTALYPKKTDNDMEEEENDGTEE